MKDTSQFHLIEMLVSISQDCANQRLFVLTYVMRLVALRLNKEHTLIMTLKKFSALEMEFVHLINAKKNLVRHTI